VAGLSRRWWWAVVHLPGEIKPEWQCVRTTKDDGAAYVSRGWLLPTSPQPAGKGWCSLRERIPLPGNGPAAGAEADGGA
jgi:hypothetical protein